MKTEDRTPERVLLDAELIYLHHKMEQGKAVQSDCSGIVNDVLQAFKSALATLDRLGYTYHGGEQFKPPLGPAGGLRGQEPHDAKLLHLPVNISGRYDQPPAGTLTIRRDAFPPTPHFYFAVAYEGTYNDWNPIALHAQLCGDNVNGREFDELVNDMVIAGREVFGDVPGGSEAVEWAKSHLRVEFKALLERKGAS